MLNCPKCRCFKLKLKVEHKSRGKEYQCLGCDARLMENATYRRTTAHQRDQMVAMRKQGLSQRAIAKVLGVAPNTVDTVLKKSEG
jgi:transposase-like protein